MDILIAYMQEKCLDEPLIGTMYCLLHADDTAIISTSRTLFIEKCNHMVEFFNDQGLSLNLKKFSYLIVDKENDSKGSLHLNLRTLDYKLSAVYLDAIITDTGSISHDIQKYIEDKRADITIKHDNFIHKNFMAPLSVKLSVLDVCVVAPIIYGSETWAVSQINSAEVIYRLGLKRALSVSGQHYSNI